jgi:hypothetical protein
MICCPSGLNCTSVLQSDPACAIPSWNMYAYDGAFCCPSNEFGFYVDNTVWVGCAGQGYSGGNDRLLKVIQSGQCPTEQYNPIKTR